MQGVDFKDAKKDHRPAAAGQHIAKFYRERFPENFTEQLDKSVLQASLNPSKSPPSFGFSGEALLLVPLRGRGRERDPRVLPPVPPKP